MTYSISDLEQLSGIRSHTIRIWEQRYRALKPKRTKGNTRLYDDSQLKRLLNIVSLNQSGLKISKICSLSEADVDDLLEKELQSVVSPAKFKWYVNQLVKYGLVYDELTFDSILTDCINKFGILDSYKNVIYPILLRLGLMWRKNDICPGQEHFFSNIIRRKIFTAINNIPVNIANDQTWLLFLPEDEEHDIGLLFAHYILKSHGKTVIFLGSKVPLESIDQVLRQSDIDNILFFMVRSKPRKAAHKYFNELLEMCGSVKVHLAGNAGVIGQLELPKNVKCFLSLEEFENSIQHPQLYERIV